MITERARVLRRIIEMLSAYLDDEDAMQSVELFPEWVNGVEYSVGYRVRHHDVLYKCLTAHLSQSTWIPPDSPSLWVRVDDPGIEWPDWVQPLGSEDAYHLGDKVTHVEKHWISSVDINIWEPGVYGWDEV